jgi:hypothetical protein
VEASVVNNPAPSSIALYKDKLKHALELEGQQAAATPDLVRRGSLGFGTPGPDSARQLLSGERPPATLPLSAVRAEVTAQHDHAAAAAPASLASPMAALHLLSERADTTAEVVGGSSRYIYGAVDVDGDGVISREEREAQAAKVQWATRRYTPGDTRAPAIPAAGGERASSTPTARRWQSDLPGRHALRDDFEAWRTLVRAAF